MSRRPGRQNFFSRLTTWVNDITEAMPLRQVLLHDAHIRQHEVAHAAVTPFRRAVEDFVGRPFEKHGYSNFR